MSQPGQPLAESASGPASRDDAAGLRHGAVVPTHEHLRHVADALIAATNAFAVERVLALFAHDAVIDDPSTGHRFDGHAGIRRYVEQYFVGYQTVTRFLSMQRLGPQREGAGGLHGGFWSRDRQPRHHRECAGPDRPAGCRPGMSGVNGLAARRPSGLACGTKLHEAEVGGAGLF